MSRRSLHILILTMFLGSASGLALCAHESLHGPLHNQQTCAICQDLLAGSQAVAPVATTIPVPVAVVAIVIIPAAQQPAVSSLPLTIGPRGPPFA